MIKANTQKQRDFYLAFTTFKEIQHEILSMDIDPVKVNANINNKKQMIEVHDYFESSFYGLRLHGFRIKAGTGKNVETIHKSLIERYGDKIKNAKIYVVLYKLVN